MKKLAPFALLLFSCFAAGAKDGYRIEVTFKQELPDSVVYLAHYFGKHLPTIYRQDSARVTGKHKVVFESPKEQLGGIFMVLYSNNSKVAEFLLDNGDRFGITIDNSDKKEGALPGLSFSGSPENDRYQEYNKKMEGLALRHKAIAEKGSKAQTLADTLALDKEYKALAEEQAGYRKAYVKKYPNTLLSNVFLALKTPEPPAQQHYLEDGKTVDSLYAYEYMKAHYWDQFNFRDDRLIQTPVYDTKLNDYFNKWVYQVPDSINAEADKILTATKGTKELFHYTLRTLSNNALQSKVMGMDEVFVHLVEQYYMKGAAYWLSDKDLEWYTDRARKIAPNVLGNTAPDLNMQDVFTLKDMPLHEVKAKYTVLIVWSYDCGHCKKEVPLLDSVYRASLKGKGVKIYSVASGGELSEIQQFINSNKIGDWINVADINNNTGFREKYDAYTTPKVYLFDEHMKIIGKGLDHRNINDVIEMTSRKAKG
ncbi:TlpA family protein disulfide reductase [Taibaiella koreensis]|uniref:TlpA family protein disulfide reductase n=1 Tax=Taibaiella koreensis TaxID=1268548 RepID=UPI000E5A0996|nr:TlpA family protein disulfide reductase [Taibaiella koreensis]